MDIKLIAFDLDGTLLTKDKHLSPRTRRALASAAEHGIELVPATGRSFAGVPEEVRFLAGVHYIITTNGAAIYTPAGELVREKIIDRKTAIEILRRSDRRRAIAAAYIAGRGYMETGDLPRAMEIGLRAEVLHYYKTTRELVPDLAEFIEMQENDIQLLAFAVDKNDRFTHEAITSLAKNYDGANLVFGSPHDMDISNSESGKGIALQYIAERLGIERTQIAAIGDSANDIDMLRIAGLSIAMENGDNAVKNSAKIIAPSNNDDGAAIIIEKILSVGCSKSGQPAKGLIGS